MKLWYIIDVNHSYKSSYGYYFMVLANFKAFLFFGLSLLSLDDFIGFIYVIYVFSLGYTIMGLLCSIDGNWRYINLCFLMSKFNVFWSPVFLA